MVLVFSFLGLYIIIIATLMIYSGKKRTIPVHSDQVLTQVSVIVAARNEEQHIHNLLQNLLKQNYPKNLYEIIIVNDHSNDHTEDILKSYNSQIKYINLPEKLSGKKQALTYGISNANGELIISTDADCMIGPTHISVIEKMYRYTHAKFISAPVIIYNNKNSVLSKLLYHFQVVEFGALITAGNALIGMRKPLLCNGANIAYPKKIFDEVKGYQGNEKIASGDDEFLLQKIATKYPDDIYFLPNPEAAVYTPSITSFKDLFQQRIRWASKHKNYNALNMAILWVVFFTNILLYASLFFLDESLYYFAIFFTFKTLIDTCLTSLYLRYTTGAKTLIYLPLIELFYPFYLLYIGIAANFFSYEWKGRIQKA